MSFVDMIKTLMFLERVNGSNRLYEYTGFYCTDGDLIARDKRYPPIRVEDLDFQQIKDRWDDLCKVYNLQYTLILNCTQYLSDVLMSKNTTLLSDSKYSDHGIYVVSLMHCDTVYHIATYAGKITIIDKLDIPFTDSLTARNMNTANLQYKDNKLSIKTERIRSNAGMIVHYDTDSIDSYEGLLSGGLCEVVHSTLRMNVKEVLGNSIQSPHYYYKHACVHAILEDSNNIDDRYNKLVKALKCVDEDLPDKLDAILDSMEESE